MYAIRLELGRELEDLLFRKMQAKRDEEELAAAKYRAKRAWYIRKFGLLIGHLGFAVGILVFLFADISKMSELQDLNEQLAKRPNFHASNPVIDISVVEEARKREQEIEELKSKRYFAEETADTDSISDNVIAKYAIAIDINNNKILASRDGRTRMYPASMTKIMTVLVAAENIPEDGIDDEFTVTPEINFYASSHGASRVGFNDNETVKVKDLFYGTILPSGGDAAVSLATYVAGSHEAFVDMMNERLVSMGLSETTHFTNCVGLYDDNHYSTCYDMAMILRAALANPLCKEVLSTRIYTTTPTDLHPNGIEISNWFLRRAEDKPIGATITCAKTGYVRQSGNCAASYATDGNGNDIIVVCGMSNGSWRCIYDHIELYRKYFPGYDPTSADKAKEEAEARNEGNT